MLRMVVTRHLSFSPPRLWYSIVLSMDTSRIIDSNTFSLDLIDLTQRHCNSHTKDTMAGQVDKQQEKGVNNQPLPRLPVVHMPFMPDGCVTPRDIDVLCGRGKTAFQHAGNEKLRYEIARNVGLFKKAASRREKSVIVRHIIRGVISNGGRFLKRTKDKTEGWRIADFNEAREKVSHALRDVGADKVKCMPAGRMAEVEKHLEMRVKGGSSLPRGEWGARGESLATIKRDYPKGKKPVKADVREPKRLLPSNKTPAQVIAEKQRAAAALEAAAAKAAAHVAEMKQRKVAASAQVKANTQAAIRACAAQQRASLEAQAEAAAQICQFQRAAAANAQASAAQASAAQVNQAQQREFAEAMRNLRHVPPLAPNGPANGVSILRNGGNKRQRTTAIEVTETAQGLQERSNNSSALLADAQQQYQDMVSTRLISEQLAALTERVNKHHHLVAAEAMHKLSTTSPSQTPNFPPRLPTHPNPGQSAVAAIADLSERVRALEEAYARRKVEEQQPNHMPSSLPQQAQTNNNIFFDARGPSSSSTRPANADPRLGLSQVFAGVQPIVISISPEEEARNVTPDGAPSSRCP